MDSATSRTESSTAGFASTSSLSHIANFGRWTAAPDKRASIAARRSARPSRPSCSTCLPTSSARPPCRGSGVSFLLVSVVPISPEPTTRPSLRSRACVNPGGMSSVLCVTSMKDGPPLLDRRGARPSRKLSLEAMSSPSQGSSRMRSLGLAIMRPGDGDLLPLPLRELRERLPYAARRTPSPRGGTSPSRRRSP